MRAWDTKQRTLAYMVTVYTGLFYSLNQTQTLKSFAVNILYIHILESTMYYYTVVPEVFDGTLDSP